MNILIFHGHFKCKRVKSTCQTEKYRDFREDRIEVHRDVIYMESIKCRFNIFNVNELQDILLILSHLHHYAREETLKLNNLMGCNSDLCWDPQVCFKFIWLPQWSRMLLFSITILVCSKFLLMFNFTNISSLWTSLSLHSTTYNDTFI